MIQYSIELADLETFTNRVGKAAAKAVDTLRNEQSKLADLHPGALGDSLAFASEGIMYQSALIHLARDVVDINKDGDVTKPVRAVPLTPEQEVEALTHLAGKYIQIAMDTARASHSGSNAGRNIYRRMEGEAAREMMNMINKFGGRLF